MAVVDLAEVLQDWPYDPDDSIRIVRCDDGREVLQVRQPMGLEQYELDGRPDGQHPHEMESALDYQLALFEEAKKEGMADQFSLSHEECVELINEGTIYYYRYVHLFQLQDWRRTDRDTARNVRLFDLVQQRAEDPEDAQCLEQWRPYILRMNAIARAMLAVGRSEHLEALDVLHETITTIESLDELEDNPTFKVEQQRSLEVLRSLEMEIGTSRPLTEMEELQKDLQDAVSEEDYERAAGLRDLIRALEEVEAQGDF